MLLHNSYLGCPRPALDGQVVARLSLAATAPPTLVGLDRFCLLSQVWADRCVSREELEEPAGRPLPPSLWRPLRILPPRGMVVLGGCELFPGPWFETAGTIL